MPTNAAVCSVYRGVNPPTNPTANTLWQSQSLRDIVISDSPGDRFLIISPFATGNDNNTCQESTLFWNSVANQWQLYYNGTTGTGGVGLAFCQGSGDPRIASNWRKYGATYDSNGVQLTTGTSVIALSQHGRAYIEGTNIYYFTWDGVSVVKCYSSTMAAPQTFTGPVTVLPALTGAAATISGNCRVMKYNNLYYMYLDVTVTAGSAAYEVALATCSTVTGTYSLVSQMLPGLWPYSANSSTNQSGTNNPPACKGGSLQAFNENGKWVGFSHWIGQDTQGSDIFRATSDDGINWTPDNGSTFLRRRTQQEVSQVADLCIVQAPNSGGYWATWEGAQNVVGANPDYMYIYITSCLETVMDYDGVCWKPINKHPANNPADFIQTGFIFASNHTLANREDAIFNTSTGNLTATLPAADWGSVCRVTNAATSGVNTLTINAAGTDTILAGASTLLKGLSYTFRCYSTGYWVRTNS